MRYALASAALAIAALAPASAQTDTAITDYKAPRTSLGHPSLEGVWLSNSILPLEAIPEAPSLVVSEADARKISDIVVRWNAELPFNFLDPEVPDLFREAGRTNGLNIVRGERRTRQIVEPADGRLPLAPAARRQARQLEQVFTSSVNPPQVADNPEQRPVWERCVALQATPPIAAPQAPHPLRIVETRDHVVLHQEYGDEARIIPYAAAHKPSNLRNPLGDSIARWEGDTLVIETVNLHPQDRVRVFPTLFLSPQSKVIEKLTRLSERELLYQYTIEDPSIYTAPWLAEYSFYRTDKKMFEFACHEGNYSLANIMRAARVADARAASRKN